MHATTLKPKTSNSTQSKRIGSATKPAKHAAIQPKLTIGPSNDKYEKEADQMAEHVTAIPGLFNGNSSKPAEPVNGVSSNAVPISRYVQRRVDHIEPPAQAKFIQRQEDQEEPAAQPKLIQRQEDSKDEEQPPAQARFIQRQEDQEDQEEPAVQPKLLQRQEDSKDEEQPPAQARFVQRQEDQEEPAAQPKLLQRQEDSNDEELSTQAKFIQRQEDHEEPTAQPTLIQRQEDESSEASAQEEEPAQPQLIQPKSGSATTAPAGMSKTLQLSKGKGAALPADTKTSMEQGFNANFDGVRIHTDSTAVSMNNSIGAQAFTHGNDIYFNEGRYKPDSDSGRKLIAHELTHTVQQGASKTLQKKPAISRSGPQIQRFVGRLLLKGLNWLAEKIIPGYSLLNVILGKNILTDDPVPRTGENLIKGFMQLIPVVGTILFNELKETNSLAKASIWVEKQVARLGINFDEIAFLLEKAWEEMSIWNGISGNLKIFVKYFGPHLNKIMAFLNVMEGKMKELRLEGALLFFGATEILASLKKNPKAFRRVAENPLVLISDALTGIRMGFDQFKANFGTHFKNAIFEWLFGKFATFNITLPKTFDAKGLFHLVAQLSGLTWPQIRAYVVKKFEPHGEAVMSKIESSVTLVKTFMTEGPIAVWEQAKEHMANIKEMILPPIISFVSGKIVKEAVLMIVSMINPASALVKLALAIYRVVKFFIDRWDQIKSLVTAILSSIRTIALGQLGKAANFIEKVMAKGMSLAIMFLARLLGIDGITKKVQQIINNFPLFKVRNKVLDIIIGHGKKFLKFVGGKAKGVKQKVKKGVDKGKELAEKGKAKVKAGVEKGKKKVKAGVKKVKGGAKKVKEKIAKVFKWWAIKSKFKTESGESHKLYFKGGETNAVLMVASNPTVLADLNSQMENKGANKKQTSKVNTYLTDLSKVQNKLKQLRKTGNKNSKLYAEKTHKYGKDIKTLTIKISVILAKLLADEKFGTEDAPLSISWPKPASKNYPVIYVGPISSKRIPQSMLKKAWSDRQNNLKDSKNIRAVESKLKKNEKDKWKDKLILKLDPDKVNTLPDGANIGVKPPFKMYAGKKFMIEQGAGTKGGDLINNKIKPYGYSPDLENLDGDHVIEMQLGGKNHVDNMWPLNKKINRSAGGIIAGAKFKVGSKIIPMSVIKQRVRVTKKQVWLKVKKVLS